MNSARASSAWSGLQQKGVALMDATFSSQTTATVARARQHSVGDLLHRTAAR